MEARLAGHPLDVAIPGNLPAVHVDASLAVQVLSNLLDNAAKYTAPGVPIHISAQGEGDGFVRVTVEDEGTGLPAGELERLFDKFQRGSAEGAIAGVGLGLAICRAIVRAHGGEIAASQRPRGGARIEFTLPTAEPAA
jgi:two-component system sensor histidine kinase KdpD